MLQVAQESELEWPVTVFWTLSEWRKDKATKLRPFYHEPWSTYKRAAPYKGVVWKVFEALSIGATTPGSLIIGKGLGCGVGDLSELRVC
jgi:hypothetical protein